MAEGRRDERAEAGSGRIALALVAILGTHLLLLGYFAPRQTMLSKVPLLSDVFGIEAYRVARVRLALEGAGRLWTYDPQVLAGQIVGLVEPLGTRALVLGVLGLGRLGVDPGRAFNGVVLAMHAVLPLVGYAAARAFGKSRAAACVSTALWSLLWFFDALVHYTWFSGRIGFALGSAAVVLGLGLLSRAATGSLRWAALAALVLGAASLLHPAAGLFGAIVVVAAAMVGAGLLPGRRGTLLAVAIAPAVALLASSGRSTALSSEPLQSVFHAGPSDLVADLLEVLGPGYGAPGAARTMVRVFCLAAGAFALAREHAFVGGRFPALGSAFLLALGLAYGGALLPVAWPIDPYFFGVLAAFAAAVPGAELVARVAWRDLWRRGPTAARVALGLLALVCIPRAARTVATFVPELLPARVVRSTVDMRVSALVGVNEPMPDALRHEPPPPRFHDVADWLAEHGGGRGRVLVDDPALTAFLSLWTPLSVLGPVGERGAATRAADPTSLLAGVPSEDAVSTYLRRYAVGFVVLGGPSGPLDREHPLLEPTVNVAGLRVRRVATEPSYFAEGAGRVVGTANGSIRVAGAGGARVTLRFHHDPGLACRPGCRLEKAELPGDPAGFLSVPAPPESFEVYVP